MNIKVTGKNIEITDSIREYVEKRLERLEKFESKNTDVNVTCSVERKAITSDCDRWCRKPVRTSKNIWRR